MSGVWVFKDGVIRRENPAASEGRRTGGGTGARRKVLVHLASGQVVSSYTSLEQILLELGWERYYAGEGNLFQFHRQSSIDLISLPRDFSNFNSIHMYDLVIKNPSVFHVRDI
ncbi:Flowering-promoting factor 1-like protein 2 [Sarracenia purpurea var. burkii]